MKNGKWKIQELAWFLFPRFLECLGIQLRKHFGKDATRTRLMRIFYKSILTWNLCFRVPVRLSLRKQQVRVILHWNTFVKNSQFYHKTQIVFIINYANYFIKTHAIFNLICTTRNLSYLMVIRNTISRKLPNCPCIKSPFRR